MGNRAREVAKDLEEVFDKISSYANDNGLGFMTLIVMPPDDNDRAPTLLTSSMEIDEVELLMLSQLKSMSEARVNKRRFDAFSELMENPMGES